MTLLLQQLILFNVLNLNKYFTKTGLTPIWSQAAPALAFVKFSNSNAQGYPQEWWITAASPFS
ncbi:hypothetical protein HMPREF0201_01130 [Cedecea davisae DSM 4568]|uniref:Uncharacterized protein n=1 Tax=Cedecea davisae DSM 4568 TaxID=566551 RepID=S3J1A3_9ENTR|nr:hypothetical protein HMPREF0201_01130 [Cedecea davisae DSM 4568]